MQNQYNAAVQHFIALLQEYNLLQKYHLERIGIFGSLVRGEVAHDVDILVENVGNYQNLIKFKDELEQLIGQKVDVVIEKFANPIVLYRAKKEIIYVSQH